MTSKTQMPEGIRTAMFWALGIGVIALILVILLIIFGNLIGNIGFGQVSRSFFNETITLDDTGDAPATAEKSVNPQTLTSVIVTNATGGDTVPASNYTLTLITFTVTDSSAFNGTDVNVSYVLTADESGKIDTDNVITNYSLSAVNISTQFPTVGTIVGIALLLVVLIGILAFAIRKMMGVATNPTGGGSGSMERGSEGGFG